MQASRAVRRPGVGVAALALLAVVPAVASAGTPAPVISSISPNPVPSTGGTTVTLTGSAFAALGVTGVTVGGQPALSWSVIDYFHMSVVVPPHAPGVVTVRVTTNYSLPPYGEIVNGLTYVLAAPSTPTAPAAAAGDALAVVTVAASSGGEPATSHLITADPGGATCTVSAATGSCTVTGLTNGTAYRFTDTAINSGGSSAASLPSAAVTPTAGLVPPASPAEPAAAVVVVPVPTAAPLPVAHSGLRPGSGTLVTSGVVPDGATSVVQSAFSGAATARELARRPTTRRASASAKCPITTTAGTRTYRCTLALSTGRWSVVTQAKAGATVVAQSVRVVTVRRVRPVVVTG